MEQLNFSQPNRKPGNGFKDLTGQQFHYLTPFERVPSGNGKRGGWKCLCKCGNITAVTTTHLTSGHTRSCGCLNSEVTAARNFKHGLTHTPEYSVWAGMITRCTRPKEPAWPNYGGRGITVCDHWLHSFTNFIEDMGQRPTPKHTIERLNNDLGYEPGNCEWRTRLEQCNNTRRNRFITFNGETLSVSQWAKRLKVNRRALSKRFERGWDAHKAFSEPYRITKVRSP